MKIIAGFLILFGLYHAAEYFILFKYNPYMFLMIQGSFLLTAFFIARWQGFKNLAAWGLLKSKKTWTEFITGMLLGFLLYFSTYLICLLSGAEKIQGIPAIASFLPKLLFFGFGVFFSSISEDILTRGYLYKHFGHRLPPVWFILFSAAIYLLNHIYRLGDGPETMTYIFLLGVLFIIPVVITRRLWLTIGMHWMGNTTFFLTHSVFDTGSGMGMLSPNTLFIFCILLFIPLTIMVSRRICKSSTIHSPFFLSTEYTFFKKIKSVKMKQLFVLIGLLFSTFVQAQSDTVRLNYENINTRAIHTGTHTYLVYFKNGKDGNRIKYQLWDRTVDIVEFRGKRTIRISQQWEDSDTLFHTALSYCDFETFSPVYQDVWWKSYGHFVFDFIGKETMVLGSPLLISDTAAYRRKMYGAFEKALKEDVFNWHLDLEVFSMLPFNEETTYAINFYDPGQSAPQVQYFTIIGSGQLEGLDQEVVDCWLLQHGSGENLETFWISKKTNEVVKLEQRSGDKYRYKIRLPFS